eukprot:2480297-Pleurochrysis_carterae.AAC.1
MVKRTRAAASAEEKLAPVVCAEGAAAASASRARAAGAQVAACAAASVGGVADLRTMRRSESRSYTFPMALYRASSGTTLLGGTTA